MTFEFNQDAPVQCASWNHILAAIDANIEIIEEILTQPKILSQKGPILDEYALALSLGKVEE